MVGGQWARGGPIGAAPADNKWSEHFSASEPSGQALFGSLIWPHPMGHLLRAKPPPAALDDRNESARRGLLPAKRHSGDC